MSTVTNPHFLIKWLNLFFSSVDELVQLTNLTVVVYNAQLDLIVETLGMCLWYPELIKVGSICWLVDTILNQQLLLQDLPSTC